MINAGTFPIFITKDVVSSSATPPSTSDCCVLGYHSGLISGGNLQIYSPFAFDSSGLFGGLRGWAGGALGFRSLWFAGSVSAEVGCGGFAAMAVKTETRRCT